MTPDDEGVEQVDLLAALQRSLTRAKEARSGAVHVRTATKTSREGEDTRDATPTRQSLNPTTSLSMIYLREFERTHSTIRGKVRLARKAGHMLRMHWAYVQCRRLAEWSES